MYTVLACECGHEPAAHRALVKVGQRGPVNVPANCRKCPLTGKGSCIEYRATQLEMIG